MGHLMEPGFFRRVAPLTGLLLGLTMTDGAGQTPPNALTDAERKAGWELLFDGRSLAGWHPYATEHRDGWKVVDGAITRVGEAGDLVTDRSFASFELRLEWKISPGGNSGVFYRGVESAEPIFRTAPEMQVLDNDGHADGKSRLTSAGSNYGLYPAPRDAVRPVGEWNEARIVARGQDVEHWLNGKKIVEYRLGGPDWTAKVKASKFAAWPGYGRAAAGVIGIQDHGDWVAFRNIKIKPL